MTVIVTMDQNRRKIKMRNKAKQDKIVLGCEDVSYVILPNVKCCSCQKRARFSRKAGFSTQKKSRSRSKEKSKHAQKKNQSCPKKAARWFGVKANVSLFLELTCLQEFSQIVSEVFLLTKNGFCHFYSLEISKINPYFFTPKNSGILKTICGHSVNPMQ